MIFDDHEVSDDWNISQAWVEEMRSLSWWDERITGAFMAYWVYQHLGNLSPPEARRGNAAEQVRQDDDAVSRWASSPADATASLRRVGGRITVISDGLGSWSSTLRAARVLSEGRREMVDPDEWDWIVEHARGSFDHLIVVTTLPAFAPPGIHHLEAWSEAICDGCWGSVAARLGANVSGARSTSSTGQHFSARSNSWLTCFA